MQGHRLERGDRRQMSHSPKPLALIALSGCTLMPESMGVAKLHVVSALSLSPAMPNRSLKLKFI